MQTIKENKRLWKTPALIGATVLGVHALIIGGVLLASGCGTTQAKKVEAPPAPVLPPTTEPVPPLAGRPIITPPLPIEPAPTMKEPGEGKTYVVQSGDSLDRIARRCGVSARELMELNGIKDANKLRIGKKLVLPVYAKELPAGKPHKAPAAHTAPGVEHPAATAGGPAYVVQSGDSLSRIAHRNGVKISDLRAANKLSGDRIRIGQKLVIPGKSEGAAPAVVEAPAAPAAADLVPAAPAAPSTLVPYEVESGKTLDDIAKMFLIKKEDIMRVNGITDPASVRAGDKLQIPL
ncbi:MAG: LysM peptidoglycan-binding domain-containing protein [Kiritimatiellaeota bacterium]|nr:LysM peptidoglycan-binding domain-containing protein [Kiritimatiellota bacterium]